MKRYLFISLLVTGSAFAQQTIKLGSHSWNLPQEPDWIYRNSDLNDTVRTYVEGFMKIGSDTIYTYDVWYGIGYPEIRKINQVVVENAAFKDMDPKLCSIEKEDSAISKYTSLFVIYLSEKESTHHTRFSSTWYTKSGFEKHDCMGILMIFCNDGALFGKLINQIKLAQQK